MSGTQLNAAHRHSDDSRFWQDALGRKGGCVMAKIRLL